MLGLKLIHVSKRVFWSLFYQTKIIWNNAEFVAGIHECLSNSETALNNMGKPHNPARMIQV